MYEDDNTLTDQQHWAPFAVGHVQCDLCNLAIPVTVMVLIDGDGRAFDHGGSRLSTQAEMTDWCAHSLLHGATS